ncbi:MAG: zinc transporter ZupT [Agathobacter sp.]|nr:zinc transporter ZupT [Agathobacter sp.]MBQ6812672.1 zinc transporter ZupT [Agathobacter sp.]
MGNIMFAFTLTLFAGLSTGVGSLIAFFAKKTNKKFLSVSLGFSAGVMIYVSMIEIFVKAQDALVSELGTKTGAIWTVVAFFGGMFLIAIIDKLIPSAENPHEARSVIAECEGCGECEICVKEAKQRREKEQLMRTGVFTALAIAIHNFPEGMATFVSAFQDPSIAIPIVAAIAIHNIPEGIAVSVPIYQATGSRRRAFAYSFLSGFAEPIGALIGWLVLIPIMSDMVYGIIFAGVAGIMVFISIDELLPAAREYGEHHLSIYGVIAGMMLMALSLLLFM